MATKMLRFLSASQSLELDGKLMGSVCAFSTEQLMELAGLSCAQAIEHVYKSNTHQHILICCGPGNNGGDGLVIARHLKHFGYNPAIFYPKKSSQQHLKNLAQQAANVGIPFIEEVNEEVLGRHQLVVDAIFGYSFKGAIRAPFDTVIPTLRKGSLPVVAVDVPSGWDVDNGDTEGTGLLPEMLISLAAPKPCARFFQGKHHFLGGRFIPHAMEKEYDLNLPPYPGSSQFVDITHLTAQLPSSNI